jgi:hypothetical protein
MKVLNTKLYKKIKEKADLKFKTPTSAYKSAWIIREYKKQGGKFERRSSSDSTGGLNEWFKNLKVSEANQHVGDQENDPEDDPVKKAAEKKAKTLVKRKATNLERYGVESTFKNPAMVAKAKATILARYGVEQQSHSSEISDKRKATNLEKYGTEYPLQNEEINAKRKATNLERYGVEIPVRNPQIVTQDNPEFFAKLEQKRLLRRFLREQELRRRQVIREKELLELQLIKQRERGLADIEARNQTAFRLTGLKKYDWM